MDDLEKSMEMPNLLENWQFLVACDLEIWCMTLENNRAPLLCYFTLCASFHSNMWIQTGVTGRKRPIWVKIGDFLSRVTLKFDRWPWKTIGHLSYATSGFVHHFIAICEFKLELWYGNGLIGFLTSVTLTFCMDITFFNGNNSWKFHDDMMRGTLWKGCDRQTDRQTDG